MNKKISVSIAMAITLIAMTVTFAITMIVSMNIFDSTVSSVRKKQVFYDKLAEIDTYVRGNFYGDIDDAALGDRVAQGYINGLSDRMSIYYTEREYNEMNDIETGALVGVGIEAELVPGGYFRIVKVYAESPAELAGIVPNLLIKSVDGVEVKDNIVTERALKTLLRGKLGSALKLVIMDETSGMQETTYEIQRVNYTTPTVIGPIVKDGYAYIRISSLGSSTYSEFDAAVREALLQNVKGFVFDVRGNTGGRFPSGHLDQVGKMIDILCPVGTVAIAGLKNPPNPVLYTSGAERLVNVPMVVLVNETTASAAELFAVNVRDLAGGEIIGTKTSGRGTIQRPPQRMSDGSAVSVTYGLLLPGSEISFNSVGLIPDIEINSEVTSSSLYNPNLETDIVIIRGLERVRSLAKAAGIETSDVPTPSSSSGSSSSSSAVADEDEAQSGVSSGTAANSSVEEGQSSSSSSSSSSSASSSRAS